MAVEQTKQVVVVSTTKSAGLAILLTVLFGPLGMLYATIPGALVMMVVSLLVAVITFGFGLIITWPICIIWAMMATNTHNKKLICGTKRY